MNKKLLKIGSAISMLNITTPIIANATMYTSFYTSNGVKNPSKTIILNTTSSTPASILNKLRHNRSIGNTTILSTNSTISHGFEIVQPYIPTNSTRIKFKHTSFIH